MRLETLQAFLDEAQGDIAPAMQGAGVTAEPTVSVWHKLTRTTRSVGAPERAAARTPRVRLSGSGS